MQRKQEQTQQLYTSQVKQYTMKRSKINMKQLMKELRKLEVEACLDALGEIRSLWSSLPSNPQNFYDLSWVVEDLAIDVCRVLIPRVRNGNKSMMVIKVNGELSSKLKMKGVMALTSLEMNLDSYYCPKYHLVLIQFAN